MSGPKLLEKRVVTAEVATQRKEQIDSGLMLAKKVDALRETLQEEEHRLSVFRSETVKAVQLEMDSYIRQKENAKEEIERLNREIHLLQMRKSQELLELPPDEQWKRVEAIFTKYDEDVKKLESLHDLTLQQISSNATKARDLAIEQGRIENLKHIASQNLAQADEMLKEAKESSARIRNEAQVVLSAAETRERAATYKEQDIETRETEVEKEKSRLLEVEVDLANRERVLKDRYATLERTLNRIKKE